MTYVKSSFYLCILLSSVSCFPLATKKKPLELPKYLDGLNTTFLKGVKVVPESYFDLVKRYRLQPLRMYTNFYVRKKNDDLIPVGKNVSEETFNNMEQFVKQYSGWPLDFQRGSDMDPEKISEEDPSATSQRTNTRIRDGPKGNHMRKAAKKNKDHKRSLFTDNSEDPLKVSELMVFFKFEHPLSANAHKKNSKLLTIKPNKATDGDNKKEHLVYFKQDKLLNGLANFIDSKVDLKSRHTSHALEDSWKHLELRNCPLEAQKGTVLNSKVSFGPDELVLGKPELPLSQSDSTVVHSKPSSKTSGDQQILSTQVLAKKALCPSDCIPLGLDTSKLMNYPQQFSTSSVCPEIENLHLRCEKINGLLCRKQFDEKKQGPFDPRILVKQKWNVGNLTLAKSHKYLQDSLT